LKKSVEPEKESVNDIIEAPELDMESNREDISNINLDEIIERISTLEIKKEEPLDLNEEEQDIEVNFHETPSYQKSLEFTQKMNKYLVDTHNLQFVGGQMAGISYPKIRGPQDKKMIIFFAPSVETDIDNELKKPNWNPFKQKNGKYVRTFLHLMKAIGDLDFFDKFILIDLFPHKLWGNDMIITDDDLRISKSWIKSQIIILKPSHVYFANKTCYKKYKKNNYQDIEKELNILFQVISHPGYTNRKQELVVEEWKKLLSDN